MPLARLKIASRTTARRRPEPRARRLRNCRGGDPPAGEIGAQAFHHTRRRGAGLRLSYFLPSEAGEVSASDAALRGHLPFAESAKGRSAQIHAIGIRLAMKRLSLAAAWVVGWLVHLRRIVWFWKASFVRPAVLTGNASREKCVFGVVLSGGDFTPGGAYPGNYGYPPNASIDYYASKGMGIIRLPFLWERVQPAQERPARRHGDVPHRSGGRSRPLQGPGGRP